MKKTAKKTSQQNKAKEAARTIEASTEIMNVRLPKDLILDLDFLVKKRIFNSRSEAIREFAREYVQEELRTKNAKNSERGGRGW